jgi:hypothetical protein
MVIFGCGVVTGALVIKTALRRPPPRDAGFRQPGNFGPAPQFQNVNLLRRMDKELALDTNQHVRIEKTMHDSQERTQQLWNSIAPGMQREVARMRIEVRDTLTPVQQKQFDTMLQTRPRHPDGPPPRDGEPHRGWQDDNHPGHGRTNGQPTNSWQSTASPSGGMATNGL